MSAYSFFDTVGKRQPYGRNSLPSAISIPAGWEVIEISITGQIKTGANKNGPTLQSKGEP